MFLNFTDSNNNELRISITIWLKNLVELKLFIFHYKKENINNKNNNNININIKIIKIL